MNTRLLFVAALFFLLTTGAGANTSEGQEALKPYRQYDTIDYRNELRIGIGGTGFERTYFPNSVHMNYTDRPATATYLEKQNHKYIPHLFIEYDYTLLPWLSLGGQVDFSGFSWDNHYYRGGSNVIIMTEPQNCYNIVIQALCRFNWLRRKHMMLYSGIGLGADINTGTEVDPYGKTTICGIAFTPVLIGISAGAGHWFGSFEVSGLNAMKDPSQILLLGGRMFSLSAGFRF